MKILTIFQLPNDLADQTNLSILSWKQESFLPSFRQPRPLTVFPFHRRESRGTNLNQSLTHRLSSRLPPLSLPPLPRLRSPRLHLFPLMILHSRSIPLPVLCGCPRLRLPKHCQDFSSLLLLPLPHHHHRHQKHQHSLLLKTNLGTTSLQAGPAPSSHSEGWERGIESFTKLDWIRT